MRLALLVIAALLILPLALLACGAQDDGEGGQAPGADAAQQPYPPAAAEPAASPEVEGTPPGQIVEVGEGPEGVT
ncbi:MAG: hypothetical protein M3R46_15685, partial [Actinomycetota bacterium]|nr:hypothetical protein [Actinomycetota bacterium]